MQKTIEADDRMGRCMKTGNGSKSSRAQPLASGNHSASAAVRERFSSAIVAGNRRELDRILREIMEVSSPSNSPGECSRTIVSLLLRSARCALKQYMVQEELRKLALSDQLTGLYNRRGFFALAGQQLKLSRRNHRCALLFFADVDGLKSINDRFGHSEGDLAIMRTAQILRDTFRDSDIIARLGGDEFAVLANEASADSQKDIWSRLKENLRAEGSRHLRYALSLSIGVARVDPRRAATLGELVMYADQAMYDAKRNSVHTSVPCGTGQQFVSRVSPAETLHGNVTSGAGVNGSTALFLATKPNSRVKLRLSSATSSGSNQKRRGGLRVENC